MTKKAAVIFLFAGVALAASASAATPPNNGPSSYDIFLHSAGDWNGEPVADDENPWHAFFESPATPALSPGVTYDDTPPDFSQLGNFDVLYISQSEADSLDGGTMADIVAWTAAGGFLVFSEVEDSFSEMAAQFGSAYEFTGTDDYPDSDNIEMSDPDHPFMNFPNVLDNNKLSGWGSSVHGAIESAGGAYECIADSVNPGDSGDRVPVLCIADYGQGVIFVMGFDPECDCHDDHLEGGGEDNAGSEFLENLVLYKGSSSAPSIPTLSEWAIALLLGLFGMTAALRFRRQRAD